MSDSEDRRPISWRRNDDTGRRRRTAGRRDRSSSSSRSPSYEERHRSRSRSPSLSEWGTRSSSPSWSLSDWGSSSPSSRSSRSSRSPSRSWRNRSRSPSRQLRRSPASPHQNGHRAEEQEDAQDRRVRDRSPINRGKRSGRSRSLSYRRRDLRIDRSRSRSPDRRRGPPRSCRSRSRTRSDECEDRRCCRPGQQEEDEEQYMSHDDEDVFVRIDSYDRLFTCAQCHDLLSPPVYECAEGHVTCARCHASANEDGEPSCRLCGERNYGRGRAAEGWLSSIRFPCRNHAHGCAAYRPRHAIDAHERACRHAPCFCPVRRCGFPGGARAALERHLTSDHGWAVVGFRYGQPFAVGVGDHAPRQVLRARRTGRCSTSEPSGGAGPQPCPWPASGRITRRRRS
ncbi:hypothetical protein PR202_ga23643 [Eleusine coracana subsp. coracana]|uniref:SIAH-type domain-containing protein n=1 Tax=Eleusine coracana subsp. coracana TaxID=191504 RepID=A0AAV5D5P9_ELECO|nr:hypothetical protein PR202_ga23643 [Eleusine coracana subsp. coracana]